MRRAIRHCPQGTWAREQAQATVTLPFEDRYRRRIQLRDDAGASFLLDLPEAAVMAEGDGLTLEGGGFIEVRAANEPVVDVRGRNEQETARLAWHIGNRHVPLQVLADGTLRIRDDHVIVAMLEGLGASPALQSAPFSPERGAYAHGSMHPAHSHEHGAAAEDRSVSPSVPQHAGSSHGH